MEKGLPVRLRTLFAVIIRAQVAGRGRFDRTKSDEALYSKEGFTHMKNTTIALLAALVVAPITPAVASDSLHIAHSAFRAEKKSQKHPAAPVHAITIIQDVANPRICIAYDNNFPKGGVGKGKVWITVERTDETETTFTLADQVRKNNYIKCTKAGDVEDLVVGDIVTFAPELTGLPRIKRKANRVDQFNIYSVVVAEGFPLPLRTVGAVPGDEETGKKGGWMHTSNFNFQAAKNNHKHPGAVTKMLVIEQDVTEPNVCFLYRNTFNKGGKGKVTAQVTHYRGEEMVDTFKIKDQVNRNKASACFDAQDLVAGDMVAWDFIFENLPRLKMGSNKVDNAEVTGVVAGNGVPDFASNTPDPGEPTPGPGPDDPPPSGGFSSADLAAAAKILYGSRPAQLWRFKGNNPTIWTVIGPGTTLGTGPGGINPATVGYGNTIAAALADYERKRGKFAAASRGLSSADIAALTWYKNINTSQGPTSVRMPRNSGTYVGEFYRPGKGVQHQAFGSFVSAINWLKSFGL